MNLKSNLYSQQDETNQIIYHVKHLPQAVKFEITSITQKL